MFFFFFLSCFLLFCFFDSVGSSSAAQQISPDMPFPFAISYPSSVPSYWGPVTATIDWCEENNVISKYVNEFVNTTSNSIFIFFACYAIYRAVYLKFETRFVLASYGFLVVGIGSWLFHMTLLYEYQLMDELPMLYATCIAFWGMFTANNTHPSSRSHDILLAIGIAVLAVAVTLTYLIVKDPTFHQVCYALLNFIVIGKSYYVIQDIDQTKYSKEISQMTRLLVGGIFFFLFGFFLWNLDVHFCPSITTWKHLVGLPYGFLLEGHGWWHFFTGLGVYYYLVSLEFLRLFIIGKQDGYYLTKRFVILPTLEFKKQAKKEI